jgi:4-oxalmesaconate hydratase
MQIFESTVLQDFPTLRLIISHGGGNVPYQAARYRAIGLMNKWEPFEAVLRRLYFDTTVYSVEAMEMLVRTVGVDNVMFASEMLGGVNAIDPKTNRLFDDNKPCLDALSWLSAEDQRKIFETNALRVYPRLRPMVAARQDTPRAATVGGE